MYVGLGKEKSLFLLRKAVFEKPGMQIHISVRFDIGTPKEFSV